MAQSGLGEDTPSTRATAVKNDDATMVDAHSAGNSPAVIPTTSGFQAVNRRATSDSHDQKAQSGIDEQSSTVNPTPTADSSKVSTPTDANAAAGTASEVGATESAYGTRSRNRTNARPNYAEDQDNMEYDYNTSVATTTAATTRKKTSAMEGSGVAMPSDAKRDSMTFNAVNGGASGGTPTNNNKDKDAAPATPNVANHQPSKKRKAGGVPASTSNTPASNTPPPSNTRKSLVASSTSASASSLPASSVQRETNLMTFTKHKNSLNKKGELVADDGTRLGVNDHVYLVCEPAGDPYYLCRVMEFLHVDSDNPNSPVDSLRVNWYYRPRDVQRFSSDSRLVYGTMHSDMCPITSLRGKCTIKHRSEIDDLDAYRKERDSFYFVQVYDRFIKRSYECIPIRQIINVPEKVKKALDERWKFVVVEIGRVKELTSAAKACKRCTKYCASHDSVDCAICKNSYHMNCVQPPLPKKPSRGFAWACGPCSRASEKKLEARNTPTASGNATEAEEEELMEEEEGPAASNDTTRAPSPDMDEMMIDDHPATQAEVALAKMWPMRYLGIHARVEDALQYDDRAIYPRASSRLGPRHQANVNVWHGRAVELVKPAEIKKRYIKGNAQKKDAKMTKETLAAIEADREEKARRPKWVQDEPPGYIARGEDYDADDPRCTARLMFKMPEADSEGDAEATTDEFVKRARTVSRSVGVPPFGTNFLDKALELWTRSGYESESTLKQLPKLDRAKDLHEPVLTKAELAKFEEGVAKYGSEHRLIRLHMKTNLTHANIVRFYYLWKKTPKGREIWGNYGGRKKRKIESDAGAKLQAEVAHDVDDSAFDNDKAAKKNRGFQCKFCHTPYSRQWRRAPGVSPGQTAQPDKNANKDKKENRPLLALCLRCAGLWRKYAIQWEDVDEVAKKVAQGGGRAWKRKIDEELLRELRIANDAAASAAPLDGSEGDGIEPPKKKAKMDAAAADKKKEKPQPPPKEPTPPPPPIIPVNPTWKILPCAVCKGLEETVTCTHCRLTVHPRCFGIQDHVGVSPKWVCEQCLNDKNPSVSTEYSCCLCLTEETQIDLVEPPRVSHKKKTDREREKERMEKELADGMRAEYRSKQTSLNRPLLPREPLKRTAGNNWVHVYCAVWSPEIRFSNAKTLEVAEGFQAIPQSRFEAVCKLCKNKDHQNRVRENAGACVSCFQCHANFHASCAFEAGYQFGFDVTPVKSSRKDQITTATLGQETGLITAAIWCKEHVVKSPIHAIDEIASENGKNALQIYIENYKQADLTLTGTVRKANLAQQTKEKGQQANAVAQSSSRRESAVHGIAAAVRRGARTSSAAELKTETDDNDSSSVQDTSVSERRCVKCNVDVTPRWHAVVQEDDGLKSSGQNNTIEQDSRYPGDGADNRPQDPNLNVRFVAPGANGRPWESAPERFGSRPPVNGEAHSAEPGPSLARSTEMNGVHQHGNNAGEGYHSHALPSYQNPARVASPTPQEAQQSSEERPMEYVCHKCFMKKKLDSTPPPEDLQARSPTDRYSSLPGADGNAEQPPTAQSIDEQFRLWDAPPPPPPPMQSQPPQPPVVNGYAPGPNAPMGPGYEYPHQPPPHMPPNHAYGPPPNYGPQPNGFHPPPPPGGPPPPQHGPHPPPPGAHPMHERHNSFGYPSQPSPHPPFNPQHRPPPPNGYPPGNPPIPNGMPSPHGNQHQHAPPSMHSPTYPSIQPHQPIHLTPIGPPHHSNPSSHYGRPTPPMGPGQGPPPGPMPHPMHSPQMVPSGLGSQPGRPSTPRGSGQMNGGPPGTLGGGGASASPSLANLLH